MEKKVGFEMTCVSPEMCREGRSQLKGFLCFQRETLGGERERELSLLAKLSKLYYFSPFYSCNMCDKQLLRKSKSKSFCNTIETDYH